MKKHFLSLLSICLILAIIITACKKETPAEPSSNPTPDPDLSFIPPSGQRQGDAATGYDYLINGDYISSGIPYNLFKMAFGNSPNLLNRTGDNASIAYNFNAVIAPNGVKIVAPNCLNCHAQEINGQLIVGLGNSLADYTTDQSTSIPTLDAGIQFTYGIPSPEYTAYEPFRKGTLAYGPYVLTDKKGVNPANKLTAILASHRNKESLVWSDTPLLNIPSGTTPTDVPAWWLLKKKNAMFYTAIGRGDFARIMMASSLLTMKDSAEARTIDNKFKDVLAYLFSIQPPVYPKTINQALAENGKTIFINNCQRCHGTYGSSSSYPNYLVDQKYVGTDPLLATDYSSINDFADSFNNSWFAMGPYAASFHTTTGYVAPPLDGVWATAPYLHNGSVPDLEVLLNSPERPTYWKRTFVSTDYDFDKVGWKYTEMNSGAGKDVYDSALPGYGNKGHTFGDFLSDTERTALIEYLKTL